MFAASPREILIASLCALGVLFLVAEVIGKIDTLAAMRRTAAEIGGLPETEGA